MKVHPNGAVSCKGGVGGRQEAAVLTVWRKSLLFNCSGFTVFDARGDLVFRVDNYGSDNKGEVLFIKKNEGEVLLMDAAGKPLLTIRRKKLSLGDHWLIYNGEEAVNPRFSVKKHVNLFHSKALAHVAPCSDGGGEDYEVEGSYTQRSCAVYDERRRPVAEVHRKEPTAGGVAFGNDVFRLVVQPELDASLAMAIVIVLDHMF
ncbi:Protein LURP-one-related 8 [Cocos nucifera]|uniref:Protein LURP-one-related 8 n=1 Tax=Cocos nucifera TaxID=13894 RepID=A0A8K0ISA6_COCNU|nr:Protein LURP-one-related 8 [Cocos nucifera]KAG1365593.1 Protein LURP-one-related 8 [Cocos nucifera]